MRVVVTFLNPEQTEARVTIEPSRLAWLFGARARSGTIIKRVAGSDPGNFACCSWHWVTTNREVPSWLIEHIELQPDDCWEYSSPEVVRELRQLSAG